MKHNFTIEHFKEKWTVEDCSRAEITKAITMYDYRYRKTHDDYFKERIDYLLKLKKRRIEYERDNFY